jgi:hypothetical protein
MGKDDDNQGKPDYVEPEEVGRFEKPLTLTPLKSSIEPLVLTQRSRVEDLGAPTVVLDRHKTPIATLLDGVKPLQKELLEKQYLEYLDTLRHYGLIEESGMTRTGDIPIPSPKSVIESFSEADLKLATGLTNPSLLLVPQISFDALKRMIDKHMEQMSIAKKREEELVSIIFKKFNGSFAEQDPTKNYGSNIGGWRAFIAGDTLSDELENRKAESEAFKRTYKDRLKNWQNFRQKGIRGLSRNEALMYLLDHKRRKNIPVVKSDIIILDEEFPKDTELLELVEQQHVEIDNIQLPHITFITYNRKTGIIYFGSSNCFTLDGEVHNAFFVPLIGGKTVIK